MVSRHVYAGSLLDRQGLKRKDDAWILAQRGSDALILAIWREKFLMRQAPAAIGHFACDPADYPWVFLGISHTGQPVFAVDLAALDQPPCPDGSAYVSLRSVWQGLPPGDAAIVAQARGLFNWRSKHGFCARCGKICQPIEAGHVMACTGCNAHHFPRTDPAVIMLIAHDDRVLLARRARNPAPVYSILAGFVEPGETLEEAVAREVAEEVGLQVDQITYHSNQPWPFPASLMIGFTAQARGTAITLDPGELQDARWLTRAALRQQDGFTLPPADSISRHMIEDWLAAAA